MFVCLDLCGGIEVWIKQTTASLLLNATLPFLSGRNISKGQVERFFSRPALKNFFGTGWARIPPEAKRRPPSAGLV
jgi:hypothetical protein